MRSSPINRVVGILTGIVLVGCAAGSTADGFDSDKVTLRGQVTLAQFGSTSGNDCWGYVSPSGREYALMGLRDKTAVVDITDPDAPVIIGSVSHNNSLSDVKVYREYAYVSNGSGGGIDIIDLSDVDNGNVTLVKRLTDDGMQESHNIAIDTDSGFLYLAVGNINSGSMVAWNLADDPENPFITGEYSGDRSHDLQVVTYKTGPYLGRQIAFSFSEGRGLDIIDVTDKKNMQLLSRSSYPNLSYCHQGWLSEDGQYLYINDELDNIPQTTVFDVTDLENPVFLNDFASSSAATDHNVYVRDGYLYEANYQAGLRIFDITSNPTDPPLAGYFDTFPEGEAGGGGGAWGNYPFFPSGIVIVSDVNRGLFILDASQAVGGTPAILADLTVIRGSLQTGDLGDLVFSDDHMVRTQSQIGFTAFEPNVTEALIGYTSNVNAPAVLNIAVESHIDHPAGTARIKLRNFDSGALESIGQYALSENESVVSFDDVDAANRIRKDGRIELSVTHTVVATFTAQGFLSDFDQVRVKVE